MYPLVKFLFTPALCLGLFFTVSSRSAAEKPPENLEALPAISPAPPVVSSAESVLTGITLPAGNALSGKAVLEAEGKIRKTPQDILLWVKLGDALAQVQRDSDDRKYYGDAEQAYAYALKLDPQSVDAIVGLAWVANGRRDLAQSVAWAKRALVLDTNNAAACGLIGDAALEIGDYDAALENYQKMMDAKPDLSSWSRGATYLWITGGRNKAIMLMERAIQAGAPFAENTAWCRAEYAMMLFNDGAMLPAQQALAPALAAGSQNPRVLMAAGTLAAARQDFVAATRYYQQVLEARPDAEAFAALGDVCAVQGEKEAAEKYYTQAAALYEAAATDEPLLAAKFYADHDRHLPNALALAERRVGTRNVLEADTLAWVYFKCGDQSHAIQSMILALSQNSADAEMQFHAGMIAAAANDRPSAQKHLAQALSYNPHFSLLQAPVAAETLAKLGSTPPEPSEAKSP